MTRWALTPPFHPYRDLAFAYNATAVCFLLHCPSHSAHAECAQALPGNLPCGARTFLGAPGRNLRHRDRPVDDFPFGNIPHSA